MDKQNEKSPAGKYEVVSPLRRNGRKYQPGDTVELTEEEAGKLKGVVALPGSAASPPVSPATGAAEAQKALDAAMAAREAAAKDLEAAKAERAEAGKALAETKKLAEQADKDRKAAEKAAKK